MKRMVLKNLIPCFAVSETRADLEFSDGRPIFKKIFKILSTFFLGRPNLFFELSQSTILKNFEKTGQKRHFYALFGSVDQKIAFFRRGFALKISIY